MKILIYIVMIIFSISSFADDDNNPLPAEKAFKLLANLGKNNTITLKWQIAKNYYLYKDKVKITPCPNSEAIIGNIKYPPSFDKQTRGGDLRSIYAESLKLNIPFKLKKSGSVLDIKVQYQGCSSKGFCYSPIMKSLTVDISKLTTQENLTPYLSDVAVAYSGEPSAQEKIENILLKHNIFIVILSFLGLGLLLSFTPCVLPMIPILSGIILGNRKRNLTTSKSFFLSLSYVLGMSVTYAIAGIVVGLIGSRIQTELQKPIVIYIFSGIFVMLALSLFNVYQLRIPSILQKSLSNLSNQQKSGNYIGVFFMGGISSLIASPCVTPPLVGVLAYIAHTGNSFIGGTALFFLGLGMGIPLLLIGTSAGKLLPKAGSWMIALEKIMGFAMLAFAIWMISRVIPGQVTLFLWSCLIIGLSAFTGAFSKKDPKFFIRKGIGIVIFIYGLILMVGSFLGNSNPLNPLESVLTKNTQNYKKTNFLTVTSLKQLNLELIKAKEQKKPVLIDFYADWCQSCIHMERYVLNRPNVQNKLSDFTLLRVDVTVNNLNDQIIMKKYNVIAPPTFIFFNKSGDELAQIKIVGEVSSTKFLSHLMKAKK
ncbi:protein-disulfide reductase DsbD [Gammaproteobacteria bacterium]|nr:protein-disulfide reductase DsbD [Gammaproteobacteria bacterium]